MKKSTHHKLNVVKVKCLSCGSEYDIGTTINHDFTVGICSNCHPSYTGKQQVLIDTASRIKAFKERQEKSQKLKSKVLSKTTDKK